MTLDIDLGRAEALLCVLTLITCKSKRFAFTDLRDTGTDLEIRSSQLRAYQQGCLSISMNLECATPSTPVRSGT